MHSKFSVARQFAMTAVSLAVATQLHAQAQPAGAGIQEIVVTAQKREESAQDIPVAIDVVSADRLIEEGIRDVKDFGKISTALDIRTGAGQALQIGIRGMQQAGFAQTGETLVAVHMDGAYMASFWGLNGLMFDLERIEVLAGPQGTLYGRNTAAGAVNIITKRPGQEFEGNGSIEYGSKDAIRVGGAVTLPLSDTFSTRIAGQYNERDALFNDGSQAVDNWSGRVSALWTPSDKDEIFFTYDHLDFNDTNDATTLLKTTNPAYANSPTLSDPYNILPYYAQRGFVFDGNNWQENDGLMLQYTHSFDGFDSILQYGRREFQNVSRASARPATAYAGQFMYAIDQTTDTAELRFLSTGTGSFEWVGGLFFYQSTSEGWAAIPSSGNNPLDPFVGLTPGCPCSFGFWPNSGDAESYAVFGQTTWTPASNDRLHLTLGLRYSYDWHNAKLGYWVGNQPIYGFGISAMPPEVQAYFANALPRPIPDSALVSSTGKNEKDWDAVQWKVGLQYDFSDTSNVYGSVGTGYKSGAFTYGTTPELEPENLLAFEIGTKNQLLNNTLQLNASTWWYDYEDLEAAVTRLLPAPIILPGNILVNSVNSTANVGQADMAGVTTELNWLATDNSQLGLNVTWTYSKINEGTEIVPAGQPNAGQVNQVYNVGERVGEAPEWQIIGRYAYMFNFAGGATLEPEAKYQWQSEKINLAIYQPQAYFPDHKQFPQAEVPARGILDLTLRFTPATASWDVTGYVRNATDELNIRSQAYDGNPASATFGNTTGVLNEPRTYGLILNARF